MKKIRAYTIEVVDSLPEINEVVWGSDYDGQRQVVKRVAPVSVDFQQVGDYVWDYEYYAVTIALEEQDDDGEWVVVCENTAFYAVKFQ